MTSTGNKPRCPLTGSDDCSLVEVISSRDIIDLYEKSFNIDIQNEFKETPTVHLYKSRAGLYFFYPAVAGSEEFYEQLQRSKSYYPEERSDFKYAAQFIEPNQKVLEVGCGSGAFSRFLPQTTYIGLEYNSSAIRKARARGLYVIKESIEEHSKRYTNWYDVVCSFQVLEHVANPRTFIESCVQAARPKGTIIFSVPNANSFLKWLPNNVLITPPHHTTIWTEESLRNIANLFSLRIVDLRCEPLSRQHSGDFLFAIINHSINRLLRKKETLIKNSSFFRFFVRTGRAVCRRIAPAVLPSNMFIGHSLYVVYQKD